MNTTEIIATAYALLMTVFSIVMVCLTYEWKIQVERKHSAIDTKWLQTKQSVDDLDTLVFNAKEDLFNLKNTFYSSGIETLKVRSEDHERAIGSLRKDLLDLQVISGTLPSRAGTMLQEVENTLEELKGLQSAYKEQQALLETTKEQLAKLATAYGELHFTGKELETIRDDLEELKRRAA
jgi:chromosome segregation ATPase